MGIKLSMNDYDVQPETYIGLACWLVMIVGIIVRTLSDRCPHCGRVRMTGGLWGGGRFCSHCGKEIE